MNLNQCNFTEHALFMEYLIRVRPDGEYAGLICYPNGTPIPDNDLWTDMKLRPSLYRKAKERLLSLGILEIDSKGCLLLRKFNDLQAPPQHNSSTTTAQLKGQVFKNQGLTTPTEQKRREEIKKRRDNNIAVSAEPAGPVMPKPIEIVSLWNTRSKGKLPEVSKLSKDRITKTKLRLEEHPLINDWEKVIDKILASPFLLGETGWKCSFDFLIHNEKNWLKIMEGNYDRPTSNKATGTAGKTNQPLAEDRRKRYESITADAVRRVTKPTEGDNASKSVSESVPGGLPAK